MKTLNVSILAVLVLSVSILAGCGQAATCSGANCITGPSADGTGMVSFALGQTQVSATHFIIRLYKGSEKFSSSSVYFQSPCSQASSGFSIDHLDEGDDFVIEYIAYTDSNCAASALVGRGVRGGVRISALGTGDGYYYVQVNRVGAFSALPLPDATLNPVTGGVPCASDGDCTRVIPCASKKACRFPITVECSIDEITAGECPDGTKLMQYNVHPKAVCGDDSICRLSSLFPLNTRGNRAFFRSVPTVSGDVVQVGGFTAFSAAGFAVEGQTADASVPETQKFSGQTAIFEVLEHNRPLESGLAMSGTAMLDDTRMVVVGGTQKAGIVVSGEINVPDLPATGCSGGCDLALSPIFYVIDTVSGNISKGTLTQAIVPSSVVSVARATPSVYIRVGVESADGAAAAPSRLSWVCAVSDSSAVSCIDVTPTGAVKRQNAAGVCVKSSGNTCSQYLVIGGTDDNGAFAEMYDAASNSVKVLAASGQIPLNLTGAVAFVADGTVWTVGGRSGATQTMASPYSYKADWDAGTIEVTAANMSGNDVKALSRVYHQATVLGDGNSVLVTGGMNSGFKALATSVLLSVAGGSMTVVDSSLTMSAPRFGHSATLVNGGISNGSVLVTGGLGSGDGKFVVGAEVYLPAD